WRLGWCSTSLTPTLSLGADYPTLFPGLKGEALIGSSGGSNTIRSLPMSALSILRTWRRTVHKQLLPELHGHQAKALADLSFGMALAQHCHSGRVADNVPGEAGPVSVRRRWERTLANPRLKALRAMRLMAS